MSNENALQAPATGSIIARLSASASRLARETLHSSSGFDFVGHQDTASSSSSGKDQTFLSSRQRNASPRAWQRVRRADPYGSFRKPGLEPSMVPADAKIVKQLTEIEGKYHCGNMQLVEAQSFARGPFMDTTRSSQHDVLNARKESATNVLPAESLPTSLVPRELNDRLVVARSVEEQKKRDGEQVTSLLTHFEESKSFEPPEDGDEIYDWGLSVNQIKRLRTITQDFLPPSDSHTSVSPDDPLNLLPRFDSTSRIEEQGMDDFVRAEWAGVLNHYTDEVWGDLLPLVTEARKELLDSRQGLSEQNRLTAVRRLRAVLAQIRGY